MSAYPFNCLVRKIKGLPSISRTGSLRKFDREVKRTCVMLSLMVSPVSFISSASFRKDVEIVCPLWYREIVEPFIINSHCFEKFTPFIEASNLLLVVCPCAACLLVAEGSRYHFCWKRLDSEVLFGEETAKGRG